MFSVMNLSCSQAGDLDDEDRDELLELLSELGARGVPKPDQMNQTIIKAAQKKLIQVRNHMILYNTSFKNILKMGKSIFYPPPHEVKTPLK